MFLAGIYLHRRHSRHSFLGIYLGFLSDGYPPQTAGMTDKFPRLVIPVKTGIQALLAFLDVRLRRPKE